METGIFRPNVRESNLEQIRDNLNRLLRRYDFPIRMIRFVPFPKNVNRLYEMVARFTKKKMRMVKLGK